MAEQVVDPVEGQDNPDERPEWLPDNFNSPEDLARSYSEAQRKITEQAQQLRGLEDSINSLTTQQEQWFAQQNQPDPNTVYSQWEEAFNNDPIGTIAAIANSTAEQVHKQYAQQAQSQPGIKPEDYAAREGVRAMEATYSDWNDYKEKVGEIVQRDPLFANDAIWVNPDLTQQALDRAYQIAKAQDVLAGNTVVQQQLADTRQMKLNAQTAVGASGRPDATTADAEEWARIKASAPKPYYG
jgi:hypothetical protein